MHDRALWEWVERTAAWGVGVVTTPSPWVVFLASKTRSAGYRLSLFAPTVGRLPRIRLLVGSLGRRPPCVDAAIISGP